MAPLSEHAKGLVITAAGVLVLTPDSLLIRLITADQWTLLFWRGLLMALGLVVIVAPLFAALLSRVLLAEPIARPTWAAIAIANTGIVVIFAGSLKSDGLLG